jgi:general secretion pathway protein G
MKRRSILYVPLMVFASVLATGCSAPRDREAILKQDLRMMRDAIDNYTLDKQHAPQSLQDLVDGRHLREIPTDPFTRKKDWVPQFDSVVLSPNQTSTGIVDVHSNSTQVGGNGAPYNEW